MTTARLQHTAHHKSVNKKGETVLRDTDGCNLHPHCVVLTRDGEIDYELSCPEPDCIAHEDTHLRMWIVSKNPAQLNLV